MNHAQPYHRSAAQQVLPAILGGIPGGLLRQASFMVLTLAVLGLAWFA